MRRCLTKEALLAFARGELPAGEAAAAEGHLETCRRCAAALDKLPVESDLVERVRDAVRSRQELEGALQRLAQTERELSTTLFGSA